MRPYLNFSPKPFARKDPLGFIFILINSVICIAVILSALYLWQIQRANQQHSGEFSRLELKKELLNEQFAQLNKDLKAMDLRAYDKEVRFYAGIQQELNAPWVNLLDALGSALPDGVRVQQVSSDGSTGEDVGQTIRLLAYARTKKDELVLLKRLQDMQDFSHVLIMNEVYEKPAIMFETRLIYHSDKGN